MNSRRPGAFYGWWNVAWAALLFGLCGLVYSQAYAVLLDPLSQATGLSSTEVSGAFLSGALLMSVTIPMFGRIVDVWGPRRVLIPAVACYAAALGLTAAAASVGPGAGWLALTGLIVSRVVAGGGIWVAASVLIAWWFSRRRGLALGLVAAFSAAGASFLPFLVGVSVGTFDLSTILLTSALVIAGLALPIAIWGVIDRPSDLGQIPDGVLGGEPAPPWGVRPRQAYATQFALILTGCSVTINIFGGGYVFHQVAIFTGQGLSATAAAVNFLPQALGSIAGFLATGVLADRYRMRWLVPASTVLFLATLGWGFSLGGPVSQFLFGLAFGVAQTAVFGFALTTFPRYFGLVHIGQIRGYFGTIALLSAALGAVLFSWVDSLTGSYTVMLLPAAIVSVLLFLWSLRVEWPRPTEGARIVV